MKSMCNVRLIIKYVLRTLITKKHMVICHSHYYKYEYTIYMHAEGKKKW